VTAFGKSTTWFRVSGTDQFLYVNVNCMGEEL